MLCESLSGKTRRSSSQCFTALALCKADRFNERGKPSAAIGELHELVKVIKLDHWFNGLARANLQPMCFHRVGDLLQVCRVEHGVIHFPRTGAAQPAKEFRVPQGLQARICRLGAADQGPAPARLEPAGDLGREDAHRHVSRDKVRANAVELLAWKVIVQGGGISNHSRQVRNPLACVLHHVLGKIDAKRHDPIAGQVLELAKK